MKSVFLYEPPHNGLAFWKNLWASLSFSYSLKITYILLRQVISPKKMVVMSVNFTNLISCLLFPLILLSALMKLASTTATILCNSMESRHPWRTSIRIEGSDRRPFILILDSILVCATLIMWIDLSPYLNLRRAEKIKSTLRIWKKDFYSVYFTHQLCSK